MHKSFLTVVFTLMFATAANATQVFCPQTFTCEASPGDKPNCTSDSGWQVMGPGNSPGGKIIAGTYVFIAVAGNINRGTYVAPDCWYASTSSNNYYVYVQNHFQRLFPDINDPSSSWIAGQPAGYWGCAVNVQGIPARCPLTT